MLGLSGGINRFAFPRVNPLFPSAGPATLSPFVLVETPVRELRAVVRLLVPKYCFDLLKTVYSRRWRRHSATRLAERTRIFRALGPIFGTIQPSAFFQADIEFIAGCTHPSFIEGIYKPRGSEYALSVSSMLASP